MNDTPSFLRQARWIWPGCNVYLHNHFARFRHDFHVPAIPERAPLFITADKSYRLYLNGRYVCRGPARGYQSHWPVDEVDVREFLRPGHNWISVEAYNPGISTFQYLHKTKAGLLCAAEWEGVSIRTDERDGSWNFGRSPGHATDTAMLTKQMEFQEHFDASLDDRAWISSPDFKDSLMAPLPWPCQENGTPFGQPPYDSVEPRGIPLLREELVEPAGFLRHAEGACADGHRDCKNVTWHFSELEFPAMRDWRPAAELRPTRAEIEVPPVGKGRLHAVTFDLGQNTPGNLIVEVDGSDGSEIVDFHYHQYLPDGVPEFHEPSVALIAISSRLRLAKGRCRHEFYHVNGIRHVTMVVRDATAALKVKISWRMAVYPFTMKGTFKCSDATLNQIHELCRRTQQVCALDAYVDTPWREQAQWWGDARVQIRNTIYLDGDMRLAARGIRSIAGQDAPHGLTYAHTPTCSGGCILPDFSLTWILTLWDYYWQTGDLSPFLAQHDRVKRIFHYFQEQRGPDGLLRYDNRFWLFEDWCSIPKEPIPAFLNLWHLHTLECYAKLLAAAGLKDEALEDIAARRELLVAKFFNPETGLFEACLDLEGKVVGEPSVHDQVLALLLGLKAEAKGAMLEKRILPFVRGGKLTCATPSSFWATYLLECLGELGYGQEAVDFIRERWSPMLPMGTAWEVFTFHESSNPSCSHAWSAHPAYHLVNILVGLRQTAPVWAEAEWKPCLVDGVEQAEATIPTPKGPLTAFWSRSGDGVEGRIEIPDGMIVQVKFPGVPEKTLRHGVHTLKGRR